MGRVGRRQARDKRQEHSRDHGQRRPHPQHAGINRQIQRADGKARGVASKHGEERSRTDYAESGASDAKYETLRQQNAAQCASASAQSRTDGELALTADGAREDKIGDVGASDDKHEAGGGKKNKENGSSAGSDLLAEEFGVDLETCLGRISVGVILDHRSIDGAKFGADLIKSGTGSETAEEFGHPMDAPVLHGCGQMMGAGDNIGNDFSIRGIWDRGFEDADDSGRSIAEAAAEANGFTDDGWIALESGRPETIGQNDDASGFRTVILRADETAEDGMKAHHVKIRAVNDAGANFPGLAEADHGETDGGELAEGGECRDACTQVVNFRHGEWDAPGADTRRALLDVNEAVLVAVDERPEEHATYQTEDGGVGTDAQRQREHHGDYQPFAARERTGREFHVVHEGQDSLLGSRIFRVALAHESYSFEFVATKAERRSRLWVQPASMPARYGAA